MIIGGFHRSLTVFRGDFIRALIDLGYEVYAVAPDLLSTPEVVDELKEWGVNCFNFPVNRTGLNPLKDLSGLITLYKSMKASQPDYVIGYTIKPVIYGTLAAWLARVPNRFALITGLGYAFTGEAKGKRKLIQFVARSLYRLALARTERVFFQNPDDQALFRQLGLLPEGHKSTVVNGSGIELNRFAKAACPEAQLNFLLIARLLGDKGVREYVLAAYHLKALYPAVSFRLVGSITDNPDAVSEEELKQWEEDGVVDYLGRLDDVRPAIKDCSVYVLPSYREGTPRSVLEAMSMGRAVITTDAPGCRETVVDGENGFLVQVKSVDELVEAMQRFIDNPELAAQMGTRSRQIAEDKYDVHKVNQVMLSAMGIKPEC